MSMKISSLAKGGESRAELLALVPPLEYNDGRTKQAFKDETDINKILQRAQRTGTISHLTKYQGRYGDFSDFDFFSVQNKLAEGRAMFDSLPSEIRREFSNSPAAFFAYVNDPANKDDLLKKLPGLAAPGRQLIDVSGKTPPAEKAVVLPAKTTASSSDERSDAGASKAVEKTDS